MEWARRAANEEGRPDQFALEWSIAGISRTVRAGCACIIRSFF